MTTYTQLRTALLASTKATNIIGLPTAPGAGTVSLADDTALGAGTDAADKFVYKVNDGTGDSSYNATVAIRITPTDDPPVICEYNKYEQSNECGLNDCIGSVAPVGVITPKTVGVKYYHSDAATCYISNGTSSSSDWEVITSASDMIADQSINQKDVVVIDSIRIDEGGGSGEDSDTLHILEIDSSNTILLPENTTNIKMYYNELAITTTATFDGATSTYANVGDTGSADENDFRIELTPVSGTTGSTTITVYIGDSSDGGTTITNVTTAQFVVNVGDVGASHNGWTNIMAVGPKRDKYGQLPDSSYLCDYSKTRCSSGECTGTADPNSSSLVPDNSTDYTIYYDSDDQKCFYYDSSQSAGSQWVTFQSYCHITDAAIEKGCSNASCIGTGAPSNAPYALNSSYFDRTNNLCYRSVGKTSASDWRIYTTPGSTTLNWDAMTVSGTGTIVGHNIYRRLAGERFDYDRPLNKSTIASNSISYVDNATNSVSAPIPGSVYYYEVRPLITSGSPSKTINTATEEAYKTARVLVPNDNLSFVHRWIVNRTVCEKMNSTSIDKTNNFRCLYEGPGDVSDTGTSYYDFSKDLIVDSFEAGCQYSKTPTCGGDTTDGNCIGVTDPSTFGGSYTSGDIYYNRANGQCYRFTGAAWANFDATIDMIEYNTSALPPLVLMDQESSNNFCARANHSDGCNASTSGSGAPSGDVTDGTRYFDTSSNFCWVESGGGVWSRVGAVLGLCSYDQSSTSDPAGDVTDGTIHFNTSAKTCWVESGAGVWTTTVAGGQIGKRLPTRKEQLAYSEWDTTTFTNSSITTLEVGLSLNSSAKCNSTSANGLSSGYTDTDSPSVSNLYSLPGSSSSGIRSIATGSSETNLCKSRYGVQDVVGNVKEWTVDRFECFGADATNLDNDFTCNSIITGTKGLSNTSADLSEMKPGNGCNYNEGNVCDGGKCFGNVGGADPNTDGVDPTASSGMTFFDTSSGNCWSSDGATWSSINASTDEFARFMLNGFQSVCVDNSAPTGECDANLTSWTIDQELFDANRFVIPMGLPMHQNFTTNFSGSSTVNYVVEIGPSSGITTSMLREDSIEINMGNLLDADNTNGIAGMATGGSYLTGDGSGTYHFELMAEVDSDTGDGELHRRVDVGLRCVAPINQTGVSGYLE